MALLCQQAKLGMFALCAIEQRHCWFELSCGVGSYPVAPYILLHIDPLKILCALAKAARGLMNPNHNCRLELARRTKKQGGLGAQAAGAAVWEGLV